MAEPLIWPLSFPTSTTTIKGADASIALLATLYTVLLWVISMPTENLTAC